MEMNSRVDRAGDELQRRSRYLTSLVQQQRRRNGSGGEESARSDGGGEVVVVVKEQGPSDEKRKRIVDSGSVRVRAADMPAELQRRAFKCARQVLGSMPKLDSKRLALTLKKDFDSTFGPAWHCIVGTSFALTSLTRGVVSSISLWIRSTFFSSGPHWSP